ncbi:MAG: MarR family transcriptional regulator [Verrucomicrobia bacterium]|nr:MarR family transcriptional regulator [Verrucomicrobiota bacterium]
MSTLLVQTLLTMARQRQGLSEHRCRTVIEFLDASESVRACIREQLAADRLTRPKLALLVALFALDPLPASPSDLAQHTGLDRPSVSVALAGLQEQKLVRGRREPTDRRRTYFRLTSAGRTAADRAAVQLLRLLGDIARLMPAGPQTRFRLGCTLLESGANATTTASHAPRGGIPLS